MIIVKKEQQAIKAEWNKREENEASQSEKCQFENKGQLKRFADSMQLMVALTISLLYKSLKSGFSKGELSWCGTILG